MIWNQIIVPVKAMEDCDTIYAIYYILWCKTDLPRL